MMLEPTVPCPCVILPTYLIMALKELFFEETEAFFIEFPSRNFRSNGLLGHNNFLLYITSGFFTEGGDSGINSGASMTADQSNGILGTNLTSFEATSSIGEVTIIIS